MRESGSYSYETIDDYVRNDQLSPAEMHNVLWKLYPDILNNINGVEDGQGGWSMSPLRLNEEDYVGRVSILDKTHQPLTADAIKADIAMIERKQKRDHQKSLDQNTEYEQNSEKFTKIMAEIFEYTVASELQENDWMGDLYDDDGRGLGTAFNPDDADAIALSRQGLVGSAVRMATEYDDYFNHVDCLFRPGGPATQKENITAFTFDTTFTADYSVLTKKLRWDLEKILEEKALLPVKYCSSEDFDQDEDPDPHARLSPVGLKNVPRFVLATTKRETYDLASTLDEQKSQAMGQTILLQLCAESLIMTKIAEQAWTDFGGLDDSPLRSVVAKENTAYDFFARAIRKKSLSAENPQVNKAPAERLRDYIAATPSNERSQTVIAFYLHRLQQIMGEEKFQAWRQTGLLIEQNGTTDNPEPITVPVSVLFQYCDYDGFLRSHRREIENEEKKKYNTEWSTAAFNSGDNGFNSARYQRVVETRRQGNAAKIEALAKKRQKEAAIATATDFNRSVDELLQKGITKVSKKSPKQLKKLLDNLQKHHDRFSPEKLSELTDQTIEAIDKYKQDYLEAKPDTDTTDDDAWQAAALQHFDRAILTDIIEEIYR